MGAVSRTKVLSMTLVIVGNMLGAGILALPVTLCAAGFLPSVVGAVLACAFMVFTAIIYSRQKALVENENADLPTFFGQELGPAGKWLTVLANLVILNGLLVAYMSGVTTTISSLVDISFPPIVVTLLFFAVGVGVISFGMGLMERCNALFILIMAVSFGVLVSLAGTNVEMSRLDRSMWAYLPAGLPVLVTSFHFHNIIPTICRGLEFDKKAIGSAVVMGCLAGLVLNIGWIIVVLGAVPYEAKDGMDLISAFHENLPATVPLSKIIHSGMLMKAGLVFALFAMTTSFMANGMALYSFMRDLLSNTFKIQGNVPAWVAAFVPSLLIAVSYPDIFIQAMNVVGGIGIDFIFGILPAALLWKYAAGRGSYKLAAVILLLFFGFILCFEVGQELGWTHISPDAEYWEYHGK
jgi:tyrosine-specific transport protein